jgi:hypothetical protein
VVSLPSLETNILIYRTIGLVLWDSHIFMLSDYRILDRRNGESFGISD